MICRASVLPAAAQTYLAVSGRVDPFSYCIKHTLLSTLITTENLGFRHAIGMNLSVPVTSSSRAKDLTAILWSKLLNGNQQFLSCELNVHPLLHRYQQPIRHFCRSSEPLADSPIGKHGGATYEHDRDDAGMWRSANDEG